MQATIKLILTYFDMIMRRRRISCGDADEDSDNNNHHRRHHHYDHRRRLLHHCYQHHHHQHHRTVLCYSVANVNINVYTIERHLGGREKNVTGENI